MQDIKDYYYGIYVGNNNNLYFPSSDTSDDAIAGLERVSASTSGIEAAASNINILVSAANSDPESEAFMSDFNIKRFSKKDN